VCVPTFCNIHGIAPRQIERAVQEVKLDSGVRERPSKMAKTSDELPAGFGVNDDDKAPATQWLLNHAQNGNADEDPTPDNRQGEGESHRASGPAPARATEVAGVLPLLRSNGCSLSVCLVAHVVSPELARK